MTVSPMKRSREHTYLVEVGRWPFHCPKTASHLLTLEFRIRAVL